MPKKLILFISMSLDGYIAKPGDDLSFLSIVERKGEDYGYADFVNSIDTILIGRKTYDWVLSKTTTYPNSDKDVYVITSTPKKDRGKIKFYNGNLNKLVANLKKQPGKNIYCDGGAMLAKAMFTDSLIDEVIISVIPIFLGKGKKLFEDGRPEQTLELLKVKNYPSGLVQLHYGVGKDLLKEIKNGD